MSTVERRIDDDGRTWEKVGCWSTGVKAIRLVEYNGKFIAHDCRTSLHFRSWETMRVAPGYPERRWGFWDGESAAPTVIRGKELYDANRSYTHEVSQLVIPPWEEAVMQEVDRYVTFGRDEKEASEWCQVPWDLVPDLEKVDVIRAYQNRPPKPPQATDAQVAAGAAAIDDLLEQLGVPADDRNRDDLGLVNGSPEETAATHPQTREIIARAAINAALAVGR